MPTRERACHVLPFPNADVEARTPTEADPTGCDILQPTSPHAYNELSLTPYILDTDRSTSCWIAPLDTRCQPLCSHLTTAAKAPHEDRASRTVSALWGDLDIPFRDALMATHNISLVSTTNGNSDTKVLSTRTRTSDPPLPVILTISMPQRSRRHFQAPNGPILQLSSPNPDNAVMKSYAKAAGSPAARNTTK